MKRLITLTVVVMFAASLAAQTNIRINSITSKKDNGILNATQYAGADIGAQVNTAIASADCPATGCEIHIPITSTGNYNFSTQIAITSKQIRLVCDGNATINNAGVNGAITMLTWTGGASAAVLMSGAAANGSMLEGCGFNNTGTGTMMLDLDNHVGSAQVNRVASVAPTVPWSTACIRFGHTALVVDPALNFVTCRQAAPVHFLVEDVEAHTRWLGVSGYGATTNEIVLGTAGGGTVLSFHCYACDFAGQVSGVTPIKIIRARSAEFTGLYTEYFGNSTTYSLDCPSTSTFCQGIVIANGFLSQTDGNTTAAIHSGLSSASITIHDNYLNGNTTGFAIFKNDGCLSCFSYNNNNNQSGAVEVIGTSGVTGMSWIDNVLAGAKDSARFSAGLQLGGTTVNALFKPDANGNLVASLATDNGTTLQYSGSTVQGPDFRIANTSRWASSLFRLGSNQSFCFASTTNGESGTCDTGWSRDSVAGTSDFGNGTQGDTTGIVKASSFTSTVATGTPPLAVSSTTNIPNLNASSLNGATFAAPGAIGGTTPGSGAFTSLAAGSAKFNINTNGLPTLSNNVTLAGQGYPLIVGITSQKNETTSADANVLTVTPASVAGSYRLCTVISVSAATTGVIGWTATWTDSNGNAQTPVELELFQNATAGPALTFTTSSASNYHSCVTIDVNGAGTNIVIKWIGGGTTTAKMTAWVERII